MKLIIYSDLHLEFKNPFRIPQLAQEQGDILILAGDIITFKNLEPLEKFVEGWEKPVLFIAGNHEYYTNKAKNKSEEKLQEFIATKKPNMTWLNNSSITLGDVAFFGGTMWTDFNKSDPMAMYQARLGMNDYKIIRTNSYSKITPEDTVKWHEEYKEKLIEWLKENKDKKRVVISHHAPTQCPTTKYALSSLSPAYNSMDMVEVILDYQPNLHVYGHTHEADDHMIGKTRIVSNPYGYHNYDSVRGFDPNGLMIEI